MKTIKKTIFTFILFIAFASAKAQIVIPASSGKTKTPKIVEGSVIKNEETLNAAQRHMREQTDTNASMRKKAGEITKTETVLTPEQKKRYDEDNAKANADMLKMPKNKQGAIEAGVDVIN